MSRVNGLEGADNHKRFGYKRSGKEDGGNYWAQAKPLEGADQLFLKKLSWLSGLAPGEFLPILMSESQFERSK